MNSDKTKDLLEKTMDEQYKLAQKLQQKDDIDSLKEAIKIYRLNPDWKDSAFRADACEKRIKGLEVVIDKKKQKRQSRTVMLVLVIVAIIVVLCLWRLPLMSKYSAAMKYLESDNYAAAGSLLEELGDYKDSKNKYQQYSERIIEQRLKEGQIGSKVKFGNYEWVIIAKENDKALLVTNSCVTEKSYNEIQMETTWETCTLRDWLNGEFYSEFGEKEKALIAETTIVNSIISSRNISGGNDTNDKIFLLSIEEVNNYFNNAYYSKVAEYKGGNCNWWLRSPGRDLAYASYISKNGAVEGGGDVVSNASVGVRPAIWIKINN